jgi:acyl-CoA reductase-like NAD-dependent aldehyde dehydrogenase
MNYIAKKFIGSKEVDGELIDVVSPYSNEVVTQYVKCNLDDVNETFKKAKRAFYETKKSPVHQRISWLEDVANKLEENKEYFALLITKEVAKPISQSRIEVQRAIENIRLVTKELINLNGETIITDATPSGFKTEAFLKGFHWELL